MDVALAVTGTQQSLHALDVAILIGTIIALFAIAYLTGKKRSNTQEFFGKKSVPALIACLSFVAAEVSAVTIIGVPSRGYQENWEYLQFFIGSTAARIFIAFLFIPMFYKFNCTTIYEFLGRRFGSQTQYAGSIFFFLTRLLGAAVRLYAAGLGISVIMGWDLAPSIVLFMLVGMIFISFGGVKAVVWTGALTTVMFLAAGFGVAWYLYAHIHGGFGEIWQTAGEAGRLKLLNFSMSLKDPNTFWAATLGAAFLNMSVFGTDQEFMQRLLTVKTRRSSQKALLGTIVAGFPLVFIYLAMGTLLFVYYHQNPGLSLPDNSDKILSHFTNHVLPVGLKGLVLTAIVLASIDSPLSSLSNSFVNDIYRRLLHTTATDRHYLWISRVAVIGFGIILCAMAYACRSLEGILWVAFQVLGVTGGSLLGVFLLGLLTKRRANWANVVAMTASAVAMAALLYLSKPDRAYLHQVPTIGLGWSWLILLGTTMTFVLGWLLGPVIDGSIPPQEHTNQAPALAATEA